jgi:hypothetical protein
MAYTLYFRMSRGPAPTESLSERERKAEARREATTATAIKTDNVRIYEKIMTVMFCNSRELKLVTSRNL